MEFTWANGRQLTGIANGSHTVSYQYDSNSIRTKKTVDGVTTEYFLNGSTVLTQVTGDTQLDFFYDDLGNALGFIKNSTDKYYYIRNLQNDVVGILDASGTQVVEYVYDTWGKLESVTAPWQQPSGVRTRSVTAGIITMKKRASITSRAATTTPRRAAS